MKIDFDKFVTLNQDNPLFYDRGKPIVELFKEYQNGNDSKFPVSIQDFNDIFNKKNISKTTYYLYRSILISLFEFIQTEYQIDVSRSINTLSDLGFNKLTQNCNEQWFFKDIIDIYDFFDKLATTRNYHPDEFMNCKCLCGLYYYGLSNEQIVNIKKTDIEFNKGYIQLEQSISERLDNQTIKNLLYMFGAPYYRNILGGSKTKLVDSDYLVLRGSKEKNEISDIRNLLLSINKSISDINKSLKVNNIRKIYFFNQVINNELTLQEMKQRFSSDNGVRKKFEEEFYQWNLWRMQSEK